MPTATGHTTAIRAKKVIGTSVKDTSGEKIGTVEDLVLDKQSNSILFAVVGFGGVLGIGEKFHPLPWTVLNYDEDEDAYVVPYTKDELKAAPHDSISELTKNDGIAYRDQSFAFYKVDQYWTQFPAIAINPDTRCQFMPDSTASSAQRRPFCLNRHHTILPLTPGTLLGSKAAGLCVIGA